MRKLSLMFALWVCLNASPAEQMPGGSGPATPGPAGVLVLSDAVEIALKNNPAVGAADAYADAVRQGIKTAQAGRYPRLDFSYSFTRSNNPVYVFGTLLTQGQFQAENFALSFLNHPPPLDNFRGCVRTSDRREAIRCRGNCPVKLQILICTIWKWRWDIIPFVSAK